MRVRPADTSPEVIWQFLGAVDSIEIDVSPESLGSVHVLAMYLGEELFRAEIERENLARVVSLSLSAGAAFYGDTPD